MRSSARSQLLELINKKWPLGPTALARALKISPQAVHRHLNALVSKGAIESRGRPPSTTYVPIDTPDFREGLKWCASATAPKPSPSVAVFETRDVFMGRLHRLERDAAGGAIDLPLMLAASGEVGNNSFDHNLGQWRDVPGCWFEAQSTRNRYWVLIADRGQGIYSSLSRALPRLKGDEAAVRAAFEERISGRSPEKRGNGLKFVREVITGAAGGVCCRSGAGSVQYGELGDECAKVVGSVVSGKVPGTVTLMAWRFRR